MRNIKYIVAPYEADAQLAYLARTGQVDAVLSEDGDMLAFGCPVVLSKFNVTNTSTKVAGGLEITLDRLLRAWELDLPRFQDMCLLAGCDYLRSLRGIGIIKAHSLIQQYHNGSMEQVRTIPIWEISPANSVKDFSSFARTRTFAGSARIPSGVANG